MNSLSSTLPSPPEILFTEPFFPQSEFRWVLIVQTGLVSFSTLGFNVWKGRHPSLLSEVDFSSKGSWCVPRKYFPIGDWRRRRGLESYARVSTHGARGFFLEESYLDSSLVWSFVRSFDRATSPQGGINKAIAEGELVIHWDRTMRRRKLINEDEDNEDQASSSCHLAPDTMYHLSGQHLMSPRTPRYRSSTNQSDSRWLCSSLGITLSFSSSYLILIVVVALICPSVSGYQSPGALEYNGEWERSSSWVFKRDTTLST